MGHTQQSHRRTQVNAAVCRPTETQRTGRSLHIYTHFYHHHHYYNNDNNSAAAVPNTIRENRQPTQPCDDDGVRTASRRSQSTEPRLCECTHHGLCSNRFARHFPNKTAEKILPLIHLFGIRNPKQFVYVVVGNLLFFYSSVSLFYFSIFFCSFPFFFS